MIFFLGMEISTGMENTDLPGDYCVFLNSVLKVVELLLKAI